MPSRKRKPRGNYNGKLAVFYRAVMFVALVVVIGIAVVVFGPGLIAKDTGASDAPELKNGESIVIKGEDDEIPDAPETAQSESYGEQKPPAVDPETVKEDKPQSPEETAPNQAAYPLKSSGYSGPGLAKKKPSPEEYMPGTSHNYAATAYAYQTRDVNNWILNKEKYTGDKKVVFLTFDDGPSPQHTPAVLDILKENKVHGTFFVVGNNFNKKGSAEIAKRQIEEGHAIGCHTYSHNYSALYPKKSANPENILAEIEKSLGIIREKTGIADFDTKVFRYPGGHMSWKNIKASDEKLAQKGIYSVDWNALTGDSESAAAGRKGESPLEHIKNDLRMYGNPKIAVVLMHDIKPDSGSSLPQIIKYFKDNGFEFGILN